jgi:RNA polymerase primary sigma factor
MIAALGKLWLRQVEAKTLRKLRHPSRSRKLRAFMDGVRD